MSTERPHQVVSLCDSDEEDETSVKRELSISIPLSTQTNGQRSSSKLSAAVIDLTLDSDSDSPPGPAAVILVPQYQSRTNGQKRKAPLDERRDGTIEPPQQRARTEASYSPTSVSNRGLQHRSNGDEERPDVAIRTASDQYDGAIYHTSSQRSAPGLIYPSTEGRHPLPPRPNFYPSQSTYHLCNYPQAGSGMASRGDW